MEGEAEYQHAGQEQQEAPEHRVQRPVRRCQGRHIHINYTYKHHFREQVAGRAFAPRGIHTGAGIPPPIERYRLTITGNLRLDPSSFGELTLEFRSASRTIGVY